MNGQVGVMSSMQGNIPQAEDHSRNNMPPPENRPPKKTKHNPGQISRTANQKVMTDMLNSNEEPSS